MRAALAIVLLAALGDAAPRFSRFCSRGPQGRSSRGLECNGGPAGPTPPSTLLAWMYPGDENTEACLCDEPPIFSGQTPAIARASNATCSKKGLATTGIANGDLVYCSSNEWRVEPSSNGKLGLRWDGQTKTNSILRSAAFDDSAWVLSSSGSTDPVVTANAGTAPDGTATADRIQFAACGSVGNVSSIYQGVSSAAVDIVNSTYFRSNPGAGNQSVSICWFSGAAGGCETVNTTEASWVRPSIDGTGANPFLVIGCVNDTAVYTGASSTGAADLLVWGAQLEVINPAFGVFASAYIPTDGSAVARAGEAADLPLGVANPTTGSAALSWEPAATVGDQFWVGTGGNSRVLYYQAPNAIAYDGTNSAGIAAALALGATKRYSVSWGTAGGFLIKNETAGTSNTATFTDASWGGSTFTIMNFLGAQGNGIISEICLDDTRAGCQP